MQIINHRLCLDNGAPYKFYENTNYPPNTKLYACEYLIIHYTTGTDPMQTINTFTNPNSKVSAHLLITRQGEIYQFVPFNIVGWHAGYSQWADREKLNRYSIGIELDNAGRLSWVNGQWIRHDKVFSGDEILIAPHKLVDVDMCWEKYPQALLDALLETAKLLKATYNFIDVVGHDDISHSGKMDPGPAFDMAAFRNEVMGFQPGQQYIFKNCKPGWVLRKEPDDLSDATGQLIDGREVVVLGYHSNWAEVQEILASGDLGALKGWMLERFLKRLRPFE
jgi:N-acetylmuramoyl-L-alanine amidase